MYTLQIDQHTKFVTSLNWTEDSIFNTLQDLYIYMMTLGMCEQIVAAAERNAIMEYITNHGSVVLQYYYYYYWYGIITYIYVQGN